jgi:hypothetical protein
MIKIIVSVKVSHLGKLSEVAEALHQAGMVSPQIIPLGFITGSCTEKLIPKLKEVDGVESIEINEDMQAI